MSKEAWRALRYWIGMLAFVAYIIYPLQYSVKFDEFSEQPTSLFRHYLSFPVFRIDLEIETDTNVPVTIALGSGEYEMLEIILPACGLLVTSADWYSRSLKVWFKNSSVASGDVVMRYRLSSRRWQEPALPQICPPENN